MTLAELITRESSTIVAEWAEFALTCTPEASVAERRDHVEAILRTIAADLGRPQTARDQAEKSRGSQDADPESDTAANSHGTDRAAHGYTPTQMQAEFRALRASILRLWLKQQTTFDRETLLELTRFHEAIDQALAESVARYAVDVDRSRDLFLGILGHDLRNPLGAILMATSFLLRESGPDWPHRRIASRILGSGARMDGIIRDLVDVTRSRLGGGISVSPAEMDLEATCRQVVDEIVSFHPECTVRFSARGDLVGRWDAGRIGQVLSNLLGNAQQHGDREQPIDVVARSAGERVLVSVHNLGKPIPRARMREIFDPFRRLQPESGAGDLRSMGLGLYISREIVEAHGGTLAVESDAGGTTFTVVLPRDTTLRAQRANPAGDEAPR